MLAYDQKSLDHQSVDSALGSPLGTASDGSRTRLVLVAGLLSSVFFLRFFLDSNFCARGLEAFVSDVDICSFLVYTILGATSDKIPCATKESVCRSTGRSIDSPLHTNFPVILKLELQTQ